MLTARASSMTLLRFFVAADLLTIKNIPPSLPSETVVREQIRAVGRIHMAASHVSIAKCCFQLNDENALSVASVYQSASTFSSATISHFARTLFVSCFSSFSSVI